MAIQTGGPFGYFTGTVGTVVGGQVLGGQYIARMLPAGYNDANTIPQYTLRASFGTLATWGSVLNKILKKSFTKRAPQNAAFQEFIARNVRRAFNTSGEVVTADMNNLRVSFGILNEIDLSIIGIVPQGTPVVSYTIDLTWAANVADPTVSEFDSVNIVVFYPDNGTYAYYQDAAQRGAETLTLNDVPYRSFDGYAYLFMRSQDLTESATSQFLGVLPGASNDPPVIIYPPASPNPVD